MSPERGRKTVILDRDGTLCREQGFIRTPEALEMLPGFDPTDHASEADLEDALGNDPLDYADRFRVVEDRGERPALFSEAPGVETEYVVLVEAHVETSRIRQRLAAAGLLSRPSGDARRYRVRVVLDEVGSYGAYQAVRTLLEEMGAQRIVRLPMVAESRSLNLSNTVAVIVYEAWRQSRFAGGA